MAMEALLAHTWPGNVRELGNVMEYAVTLCDGAIVEPQHLPPYLFTPSAPSQSETIDDLVYRTARERFERRYLSSLLRTSGGNLSEAARRSGIDRSNLRRMMHRLGVDAQGRPTVPVGDDESSKSGE